MPRHSRGEKFAEYFRFAAARKGTQRLISHGRTRSARAPRRHRQRCADCRREKVLVCTFAADEIKAITDRLSNLHVQKLQKAMVCPEHAAANFFLACRQCCSNLCGNNMCCKSRSA
jgi:hypothetical protein